MTDKKTAFKNKNLKRGFIQSVFLVVGALVLLKYLYDIDIVNSLTQGRFKELLDQFYNLASKSWGKYNYLVIKIWNYIVEIVKKYI